MASLEISCNHLRERSEIIACLKEQQAEEEKLKVKYNKIEQKLHQIATFYRQHPQNTLPKAIVEAIARYDEDLIHDQRSVSYAMHNAGDEIESWFEELADEKHRATVAGCPCVKKFTDIV